MQVTIPSGRSSLEVVVEVSFQLSKLLSLRKSSQEVVEGVPFQLSELLSLSRAAVLEVVIGLSEPYPSL